MKGWIFFWIFIVAFAVTTLPLNGCGGSGGGSSSSPVPAVVDGKVVRGPVSGARIIADKSSPYAPYNNALDDGESYTWSKADGTFDDLIIEDPGSYGEYRLLSIGGVDILSGLAAAPMLAPAGAKIITGLTTVVALAPPEEQDALKEKLTAIAGADGSWDSDPSDEAGVPADFLALTKVVEEAQVFMESLGLHAVEDQLDGLVLELATTLSAQDSLSLGNDTGSVLAAAITDAVSASAEDAGIVADGGDLAADVANLIDGITAVVGTGTGVVYETEAVATDVATRTATTISDVIENNDAVKMVYMTVEQVTHNDTQVYPEQNPTSEAEANLLHVDFDAVNTTGELKRYEPVLIVSVTDDASSRVTELKLTGLEVEIASTEATLTLSESAAGFFIAGEAVDSEGNHIAMIDALSLDAGEVEIVQGHSLTIDLDAIQDALAAEVSDYGDISLPGSYRMVLSVEDMSMPAVGVSIGINE